MMSILVLSIWLPLMKQVATLFCILCYVKWTCVKRIGPVLLHPLRTTVLHLDKIIKNLTRIWVLW